MGVVCKALIHGSVCHLQRRDGQPLEVVCEGVAFHSIELDAVAVPGVGDVRFRVTLGQNLPSEISLDVPLGSLGFVVPVRWLCGMQERERREEL